ncbi:peptidoglycan-binding protein [Actinoplanes sp. RD1]|uniref:peptidoglycan-binding protein n=1 Tax=Actinoplanes sp. RD1 TaxID=3064538 RepID=UPI00274199CA|nr:peptidoglycan-binding protein [Actinoplanes sp. RD1]
MRRTSPDWLIALAAASPGGAPPAAPTSLRSVPSRYSGRALARVPDEPMRGGDVAELQSQLIALGYDAEVGPVDGVFGARTEAAVRRFQTDYGALNDGVYGRVNRRVMSFLRQQNVGRDRPATVQQRHLISFIVQAQHTGLLLIDLVSDGARPPTPRGEYADRIKRELGEALEQRIQEFTGMQSWLLHGPEFRNNAHQLASFANNIDAELYIAVSLANEPEEGPGCRVSYFGTSEDTYSHVGRPLAEMVHRRVLAESGAGDRGLRAESSVLFEQAHVPTVRVEFANLAHPADRALLRSGVSYLDKVATGIARGIRAFYLLGQPDAGPGAGTFAQLSLRRGHETR